MARLTAAGRKKIPKEQFGLPGKKAYPMPDRAHAANAKANRILYGSSSGPKKKGRRP